MSSLEASPQASSHAAHPSAIPAAQAAQSKTKQTWWQTKRARTVGMLVVVALIVGVVIWAIAFRPFVSTEDARVAMTMIRLAPSGVSGRIEKVNVVEGSRVKAGEVLVEIDHRVPQANYDRAKAKADLANVELSRMQRLTAEGSSPRQALDEARADAAAAEVDLKLAEVALENTYLKSPFDGVVVQKLADPGNLLEASQTAIVVADVDHAWVAANIEETSVGELKTGQPVHISIDEGGTLEGKVSEIRSSVASQFALIPSDSGSGNFTKVVQRVPIKVALEPHPNFVLRAGQSVEIKIRAH